MGREGTFSTVHCKNGFGRVAGGDISSLIPPPLTLLCLPSYPLLPPPPLFLPSILSLQPPTLHFLLSLYPFFSHSTLSPLTQSFLLSLSFLNISYCTLLLIIFTHYFSLELLTIHLTSFHLISSHLISSHLISSQSISLHITSYHLPTFNLTSSHLISSLFIFPYRVFEIFGPSTIGPITAADIEDLVQSILPDTMLLRKESLQDFERTLLLQDGVDNQL